MSDIVLFTDLDETVFQLSRHNAAGKHPATATPTPQHVSYQTDYQRLLFDLFYQAEQVTVIPVTARDLRQYHNTFVSRLPKIETAVLYFGGLIWHQHRPLPEWANHIYQAFQSLSQPLADLQQELSQFIAKHAPSSVLRNSDGYYLTLRAPAELTPSEREAFFAEVKTLASAEYLSYSHRRNLTLLPQFLDKRHAVAYLQSQLAPKLSLGMGDSLSDLPFMQLCDIRMIPRYAQIEQLFPACLTPTP